MNVSRERRLEMAVQTLSSIIAGAMEDLDRMKQAHPPSKRGSRYQAALESLEQRLAVGEAEAREASDDPGREGEREGG